MLAKKCDRCGQYFDHYGNEKSPPEPNGARLVYSTCDGAITTFNYLTVKREKSTAIFDLCPACMAALVDFLEIGKTEGKS